MLLSDVCLSVAYIWPKSRTKRPARTTSIGTEVAHVKIAIWIEVRIVSASSFTDLCPFYNATLVSGAEVDNGGNVGRSIPAGESDFVPAAL